MGEHQSHRRFPCGFNTEQRSLPWVHVPAVTRHGCTYSRCPTDDTWAGSGQHATARGSISADHVLLLNLCGARMFHSELQTLLLYFGFPSKERNASVLFGVAFSCMPVNFRMQNMFSKTKRVSLVSLHQIVTALCSQHLL